MLEELALLKKIAALQGPDLDERLFGLEPGLAPHRTTVAVLELPGSVLASGIVMGCLAQASAASMAER